MTETPFFFPNDIKQLFGILHQPSLELSNGKGYIFIHPFAEEKLWTHLVLVNFARELTNKGYTILRFDFMGHGDSEGDFKDSNIATRLKDIEYAIKLFQQKAPNVKELGLLGLRFGATLAALACEQHPDISKLILWEPIIGGEKYMQELLRINLATQNAVYKEIRHTREDLVQMMHDGIDANVDGYEISYDLYSQATEINLLAESEKQFSGDCLIVQIGRTLKIKKDFETLNSIYNKSNLELVVEEPFWKEIKTFYARATNLYKVTIEWLGE